MKTDARTTRLPDGPGDPPWQLNAASGGTFGRQPHPVRAGAAAQQAIPGALPIDVTPLANKAGHHFGDSLTPGRRASFLRPPDLPASDA